MFVGNYFFFKKGVVRKGRFLGEILRREREVGGEY